MRRLSLTLLLLQMFVALGMGAEVTFCQYASAIKMDGRCTHANHHHHSHGESHHGEIPENRSGDCCEALLSEAVTPSLVKVPCDVPTLLVTTLPSSPNLLDRILIAQINSFELKFQIGSPPTTPLREITSCFLI